MTVGDTALTLNVTNVSHAIVKSVVIKIVYVLYKWHRISSVFSA